MGRIKIDLFSIAHAKVEFIPVLKIYTIRILGRILNSEKILIFTLQNDIWRGGSAKAVALCSVKTENLQTGNDQLEFILGQLDTETWRQNFQDTLTKSRNNKLKKISMVDCNRVAAFLNSEEIMDYMNLVVDLDELTKETEMFKLLTLVALFSANEDLSPEAAQFVTEVRNQYLSIVRKKIGPESESGSESRVYEKLCFGLDEVDQLSAYLKKLEVKEE